MTKIQQLKAELKALAIELKTKKQSYKESQQKLSAFDNEHPNAINEWRSELYTQRNNLRWNGASHPLPDQHHYRCMHIAYCLLRGTPYELIESKVRPGNEIVEDSRYRPSWKKINEIMEAYRETETVCDHAI